MIRSQGYLFSIFCIAAYFITNRITRVILEPLNQWPAMDQSGYFFQFADHARPEVSMMMLSIWMILFVLYNKLNHWLKFMRLK